MRCFHQTSNFFLSMNYGCYYHLKRPIQMMFKTFNLQEYPRRKLLYYKIHNKNTPYSFLILLMDVTKR